MKSSDSNGLTVGAVIVCAGRGARTGLAYNKVLHMLGQKTVVETVLDAFEGKTDKTVLVVSPADREKIAELAAPYADVTLCDGGETRFSSVYNGLKALGDCEVVLIHDGARPFVTSEIIDACIDSTAKFGSGIAAVPTVDTIKTVCGNRITSSLDRSALVNVQTPQAFKYNEITSAYEKAVASGKSSFTDDSEVYAQAGYSPVTVRGSYDNIKITTPNDLFGKTPRGMHIGAGFDVHRLVEGRKLVLGGVRIPYELGLFGHSDADVLTHAVMDALLSAAGAPDIGVLFPDTSPETDGISSTVLLDRVMNMLDERGLEITSVSAVVIAQKPKLAPHIQSIRKSLSDYMHTDVSAVNVSATTTEHLGIVGDGKAIAASATCLLTEKK